MATEDEGFWRRYLKTHKDYAEGDDLTGVLWLLLGTAGLGWAALAYWLVRYWCFQ